MLAPKISQIVLEAVKNIDDIKEQDDVKIFADTNNDDPDI